MLRPQDIRELDRRGYRYLLLEWPGETLIILKEYVLPEGLSPRCADLLVRVPSLFPVVKPDMFWMAPAATRCDGLVIPATQVTETIAERQWQRWSRHLQASQWRADRDDLGTYLDIIDHCLQAAA